MSDLEEIENIEEALNIDQENFEETLAANAIVSQRKKKKERSQIFRRNRS